jgi:hypothetical protein
MKKTTAILTSLMISMTSFGQWTTLITDASGDASGGGLDGTVLEYRYDEPNDKVLFRITCTNLSMHSGTPSADFSFALPNGLDSGGPTGTHWTSSTPVHKTAASYADPGGSAPSTYTFSSMGAWQDEIVETSSGASLCASTCVAINTNVAMNQITYTFDRTGIITDTEMGGNSAIVGLVMNVGNNIGWADAITHSQGGASNITFTITKTATSIDNLKEIIGFNIYPNPTSNTLYLDYKEDIRKIIIHDVTGKEVLQINGVQINSLDVADLERGLYFVSIFDNSQQLLGSSRFVKK